MTTRLGALVQVLGLGTGGQLGTRLAERFGIATSPSSLLRTLMQVRASRIPAVRVLGVDDWSATRSRMYSCKDSRKEDLTWGSAPSAEHSLNQVRPGKCSRVRKDGD